MTASPAITVAPRGSTVAAGGTSTVLSGVDFVQRASARALKFSEEEEVMICNLGKQRVSDIDRIIDV